MVGGDDEPGELSEAERSEASRLGGVGVWYGVPKVCRYVWVNGAPLGSVGWGVGWGTPPLYPPLVY